MNTKELTNKLNELLDTCNKTKEEASILSGELNSLMSTLKEEYNVASTEEAKELLQSMQEEIAEKQEELEIEYEELKNEFASFEKEIRRSDSV